MAYSNEDVCFLAQGTKILTTKGYMVVDELSLDDELISANNKVSSIQEITYHDVSVDSGLHDVFNVDNVNSEKSEDFGAKDADDFECYALNFSNGETVFATTKQKWKIYSNERTVSCNTKRLHEKFSDSENIFIPSPQGIDSSVNFDIQVQAIVDNDRILKKLLRGHDFSHAAILITKAYCHIVNNSPADDAPLIVDKAVEDFIVSHYGRDVFELVKDGALPVWFSVMPISVRHSCCGIILDDIIDVFFEQSIRRTYVRFDVNPFFFDDISALLTSVGCTREVSLSMADIKDSEEIKTKTINLLSAFCLNEEIRKFSLKTFEQYPVSDKFNGLDVVSVDNIRKVYAKDMGINGFYEIKISPKTRGVIIGNAPVLMFPF